MTASWRTSTTDGVSADANSAGLDLFGMLAAVGGRRPQSAPHLARDVAQGYLR